MFKNSFVLLFSVILDLDLCEVEALFQVGASSLIYDLHPVGFICGRFQIHQLKHHRSSVNRLLPDWFSQIS